MVLRAVWVGGGCFTGAAKATQGYFRRFFLLKKRTNTRMSHRFPGEPGWGRNRDFLLCLEALAMLLGSNANT